MSRVWPTVTTHWLRKALGSEVKSRSIKGGGVRVLDVSLQPTNTVDQNREHYHSGHIPEAVFYDMWNSVTSTPEIPRNLPEIGGFTEYIRDMGIWNNTHVVAYDRFGPITAYRTWWLFRLYGHRNVSVLDGGLAKWQQDGYELTTETPKFQRSDAKVQFDSSLAMKYEAMADNLYTQQYQVVDARHLDVALEEENGTGKQQGYIPGSKIVDFRALFNTSDGTIKSKDELQNMFTDAGVELWKPVVTTCLLGMRACALAAALEMIGYPDIPVYYGAWTEWRQRSDDQMKDLLNTTQTIPH